MNPYSPPTANAVDPSHVVLESAKRRLARPATALIVMASIHAVFIAISIVSVIATLSQEVSIAKGQISLHELVGLAVGILQFGILVLISIGAAKMGFLESYKIARLGACFACVPFATPFVILGLPFGVWSLVLLRHPEIKIAFVVSNTNQRKSSPLKEPDSGV